MEILNELCERRTVKKANRIAGCLAAGLLPILFTGIITAQSAGNWTRQIPSAFPFSRIAPAMAYDSARGQVVLFGGDVGTGLNDTWIWDGSNWAQKSPQNRPPTRRGSAIVYDSAHDQMVLFGGLSSSSDYMADTWVWDGNNWIQKFPQTSPPARGYYAMVYDSAHRQVVLFGGDIGASITNTANTPSNDTWTWDGSNWTQRSPQASPPKRIYHAMSYDSARGQTVLFGGFNGSSTSGATDLNDTWIWDGSNWTQKAPQNSPLELERLAMAYDSAHAQVVLFGGDSELAGFVNDTWTWDGSNWTQKSPQNSPSARVSPGMAYDAAHSQILLFGGNAISGIAGDTWVWDGGTGGAPVINGVVSASAYGGFPSVAPGSWVEIYGLNLGPHARQWAGSDFSGNNAPTMLDGVQATIGGQKAFVDYISTGQVNAQLPSNIGTGALQISLTNGNVTSAPFNIMVNTTQAGLLAPPSFKVGANQYVVAQFADGTYVLPAGAIATVASRPAKPGETIVIYGVGFGPVTPVFLAGQIVTQINQLSTSLQIRFGQTPAQMQYFGLAPNFVGLYQFNVVIPAVADNDLVPLTFNLGGIAGTQTLYIAVRQ